MDLLDRLKILNTPLNQNWEEFSKHLLFKKLEKKKLLIRKGQVEQNLYFLQEGIARFYTHHGEKEITFDFAFNGSFFCAFTSFLTETPCQYNIQALTPLSLSYVPKKVLENLYQSSPQALAMGKWAAEQQFLKKSSREFSLLTDSAEERYLSLFKSNPHLIQYIPLKYLASYIGVTPQALSRIRRRIAIS